VKSIECETGDTWGSHLQHWALPHTRQIGVVELLVRRTVDLLHTGRGHLLHLARRHDGQGMRKKKIVLSEKKELKFCRGNEELQETNAESVSGTMGIAGRLVSAIHMR
jgi:hypothetical protein